MSTNNDENRIMISMLQTDVISLASSIDKIKQTQTEINGTILNFLELLQLEDERLDLQREMIDELKTQVKQQEHFMLIAQDNITNFVNSTIASQSTSQPSQSSTSSNSGTQPTTNTINYY